MTAGPPAPLRAPRGWSPQSVLAAHFPDAAALGRAALPEIRARERRLDADEAAGRDTARLRQAVGELTWRLQYTGDAVATAAALARVRALAAAPAAPIGPPRDAEGSLGVGTDVWFLKLDASADALLADDFDAGGDPPRFLDCVNEPRRLAAYLEGLRVSRLTEDGIDRRKELNYATAGLVRLILRRRPRGYPWHPRLAGVVRRFVAGWQDRETGFFGADYAVGGGLWRTADLSLTFHMARYLSGKIGYWPQLIDTLIDIRDDRYPNGWLDEEGMTNHNNYDVAVLLGLGWRHMRRDQRERGRRELARLLAWCLDSAIAADGTVTARAVGESLPDSYYFMVAFLDTVGFFNPSKCFWTEREFSDAPVLRARLAARLCGLPPGNPMVRLALGRLRA